ncbi:hemicentin-1-like [Leucoraja erinacea]|uniref:hemicentin-1-like n=1 Tax=Leucoraja erinaceus TaxID=7782 RepID=UPI002454C278|nr:hemicentin-1-like [Leucoraja erinacea]
MALALWPLALLCSLPPLAAEPAASTLAFVFDVTGSMYDDLRQVTQGAAAILRSTLARTATPGGNFVLVPFHDPEIGPVTITSDPKIFQKELQDLYVQGGGDCPEMSLSAIKRALEVSLPSSFIYVFTDARAKDYQLTKDVLQLIQQKQSQVVFVLTGDCGDRGHPGYRAYEEVASTSSGQIFHLDKQQVNEVLKWVEETIQASKVHLVSTNHQEREEHVWLVPFDPSLKDVTISLSGPAPAIEVRDPSGRVLWRGLGLNELLNIPNSARVVNVKSPRPGMWTIKLRSAGRHSVRITGVSNIDFQVGFSTKPTSDFSKTMERPIQGITTHILLNCSGLQPPGQLEGLEFLSTTGQPLQSLPITAHSGRTTTNIWEVPQILPPSESFFLKVTGHDEEGYPFQRLSSVSYTSLVPGPPKVSVPAQAHAFYQQSASIPCSVESLIPFTLRLIRGGTKVQPDRLFEDTVNTTWEIPGVSGSDEGFYDCVAISSSGTGIGRLYLVVTEPPPSVEIPRNITAFPGDQVVLTCRVLGSIRYNVTWMRDGIELQSDNERIIPLKNSSLEFREVWPEDAGRYECVVINTHGWSRASIWLFIPEAPRVSVNPRAQSFTRGAEARINCVVEATYPEPGMAWIRDGVFVTSTDRLSISEHGTLILRDAVPEDAGRYICLASNMVGTAQEEATLMYTEMPRIAVPYPVVLAVVTEVALLECQATGIPQPEVTWYKGDLEMTLVPFAEIHPFQGTMMIMDVQEFDAGEYTCVATNEAGSSAAEVMLDVGSVPMFSEAPSDVSVAIGKNVTLPCSADGFPTPQITWQRLDGQPIFSRLDSMSLVSQLETGSLFIENVWLDDEARYVCEAQNQFGAIRVEVALTVTGLVAPEVVESAPAVSVLEGRSLTLPCVILAGNPYPERYWLKDNKMLSLDRRLSIRSDGSFHIERAERGDAGRYVCTITNLMGSVNKTITVNVHVHPSINAGHVILTTEEEVPVTLHCESTGAPKPTVVWSKDGVRLHPGESQYNTDANGSLVIAAPSSEDAGVYVCTASNVVGFASRELQLFVHTKPKIGEMNPEDLGGLIEISGTAGTEVTLPCEVQASPPPIVRWKKDSRLLPVSSARYTFLPSGSLRILDSRVSDSGLYRCSAINRVGNASLTLQLIIHVPPKIQPSHHLLKAIVGQFVDLPCLAHGDPMPEIRWYRGDEALLQGARDALDGPDGSVSIEDVELSDTGVYRCVATNNVGQDVSEMTLMVLEPPFFAEDDAPFDAEQERLAKERVILPCPAEGTPPPVIHWLQNGLELLGNEPGVSILEDGSLLLESLLPYNSGDYLCIATNEAGSSKRKFRLQVRVPPEIQNNYQIQNVTALINQPLTLECDATGTPPPAISWYKNRQPVAGMSRLRLLNGGRLLRLPKVRKEDSGTYVCKALNVAGNTDKHVHLLVQVPPMIFRSGITQEVAVLVNSELELKCRTNGIPFPIIRWSKDGVGLSLGSNRVEFVEEGQVLRIQSARLLDQGLYQCTAHNPAGHQSKHFNVDVHVPPTIRGANDTREVNVMLHSHVSLECDSHGVPDPGITWLKDNRPIVSSSKMMYVEGGRLLQLHGAQAPDAGWYTCRARNIAGTVKKSYKVQVYVPPSIDESSGHPSKTKAIVGHSLTLKCSSSGYPPPELSWLKDGARLMGSERVQILAKGKTLKIKNAGVGDAGTYVCIAHSVAGEHQLHYTVDILVPPQLLSGDSSPVTVTIDNPLELTCLASGHPAPRITWLREDAPLTGHDGPWVLADQSRLFIDRIKLTDVGQYVCLASNEAGEVRREFDITVHVPPEVKIVGTESRTVVTGQSVTLECSVTGIPTPLITWLKGGQMLPRTNGILMIGRVTQNDGGIYSCVGNNEAGESEQDVRLIVFDLPVIDASADTNKSVIVNHSVTFNCIATGAPTPVLTWLKGNQLITSTAGVSVLEDGGILQIHNVQVSDRGLYRCVASSVGGSTELLYTLHVYVPPVISAVLDKVSVLLNEHVDLQCEAAGVPEPTVTWLKDETLVIMMSERLKFFSNGQILSLASAHHSDSGTYTCIAANSAGEDQAEIHLQVYLPPTILGQEQNVSITLNGSVSLECQSQAVPPPTLTWTKDGQPLARHAGLVFSQNDSLIQIKSARVQDAGRYTCKASNDAGKTEKSHYLNVWVPPSFHRPMDQTSVTVIEGNSLSLFCECSGIPSPRLQWWKNGLLLTSEDNGQIIVHSGRQMLRILGTRISDSGNYTCVGTNVAGTSSQDYSVEVYATPTIKNGDGQQTEVSVIKGAAATLKCDAHGVPQPTLTWVKDSRPLVTTQDIWVENEGQLLHVQSAQEQHAGRYTCLAVNAAGRAQRTFALSVLVPPAILGEMGSAENTSTLLSNPLTLLCEASGTPPPTFTWFRNGSPIVSSSNMQVLSGGRTLRLSRVLVGDTGRYVCVVNNTAGEARKDFHLDVLSPPHILGEDLVGKIHVREGETLNLTCLATGNPQPGVTWWKDGRVVNGSAGYAVSSDGSTLEILHTGLSHTGQYTCLATNTVGHTSKNYHLSVFIAPRIASAAEDGTPEDVVVIVNNPTSLVCEAVAYPSPTITWFKDGVAFTASRNMHLLPGGRGLQILSVQEENAGHYSCVVTNEAGEAVKDYELKVFIPPQIVKDGGTVGNFRVTQVKTKVNTSLTLTCESWAVPAPVLRWYKDGQLLAGTEHLQILDNGRILQIKHTKVSDTGRYTCVATNIAGEDEKDFHVNIQVPPIFQKAHGVNAAWEVIFREDEVEDIVERREVIVNNPVSLYCETNAIPPPKLSWSKDGHALSATDDILILPGSHILQIPRVRADDAGRYTCQAVNEVGEDKLHYELVVLVPPTIPAGGEGFGEEITLTVNATIQLRCMAVGSPEPSITWLRDGQPITTDRRHQRLDGGKILQIHSVQLSDTGDHICIAENPTGSTERRFSLRIQVPPAVLGPNPESVKVVVNNPVRLTCESRAVPAADVTWHRNGVLLQFSADILFLPGDHVLQIPRARTEHSGKYTCVATNAAGSDEKHIHLHVNTPPTIKQDGDRYSDTITVRVGENVALRCESDATIPVPTIVWYLNDHQLPFGDVSRIRPEGQTLHIEDVQVTDSGQYTCKVTNLAGHVKRTFRLNVHAPPTFEEPQHEVVVQVAGSALVLSCHATGVPPPTITWQKDGQSIESSNRLDWHILPSGTSLQTDQLQPAQGGNYTCLARNGEGETRRHYTLIVQVSPSILGSDVPSEYDALVNEDVNLECVALGEPKPALRWLKDSKPLETLGQIHIELSSDGSSLHIRGALTSDAGRYTCVAQNPAGEEAKLFILNVMVPPNISGIPGLPEMVAAVPNAVVTLECRAAGVPPPRLSWLKDGLPLPISSRIRLQSSARILRIAEVQVSDAGSYTCVAGSQAGVAERHYHLRIQVPPRIENSRDREEVLVIQGTSVTLTCEASGFPPPLFSWLKDGELLVLNELVTESHGMRLELPAVSLDDSGWYSCIATNEVGKATRHFSLVVMEPPHISRSETTQEVSVVVNSPLELTCMAVGIPVPGIRWLRDGAPLSGIGLVLSDGKILRIDRVQVEDAGLYTCLATSPAGEDQQHHLVKIHVPPNVRGSSDPRLVTLMAEEQLTLECTSEAVPPPTVQWFKDDLPVQAGSHIQHEPDSQYLVISHVDIADTGMYRCHISNIAGAMSRVFNVIVQVTPTVKSGSPTLAIFINQPALLECEVHGYPKPTVTWRKDGSLLSPENPRFDFLPNGSLRIPSVQVFDAGRYLCSASSAVGSDQHWIELQVLGAPVISPSPTNVTAVANTQAQMSCEVSGSPKPEVTWKKNGKPLNFNLQQNMYRLLPSGSMLVLSVTTEDTSLYECRATNEVGDSHRLIQLTVHVPPSIADDSPDVTVSTMSPVVLPCHVTGIPKPSVTWMKDGGQLGNRGPGYKVLPTGALEIALAKLSHGGYYLCTARNVVGTAHKHVALIVQEPPVIKPPPATFEIVVNHGIILPCEWTGTPRPSITWQKDGVTISSSGYFMLANGALEIVRATEEDSGHYMCIAQNAAGTALGKTKLVVQVPPEIKADSREYKATIHHSTTLPCEVAGRPNPKVTWVKDGRPLSDQRYMQMFANGTLHIPQVQLADAGWYTCIARNKVGVVSVDRTLVVQVPPLILLGQSEFSVLEDSQVLLPCAVQGLPVPAVYWEKDGVTVPDAPGRFTALQSGELIVENTTPEDAGVYTCTAVNPVGKDSHRIHLSVSVQPAFTELPADVSLHKGERLLLTCAAKGLPTPSISWTFNNKPIAVRSSQTEGLSELLIKRVSKEDSGTYVCTAENIVGVIRAIGFVYVKEAPVLWGEVSAYQMEPLGGNVILSCDARGDPVPSINWNKDGSPLTVSNRIRQMNNGSLAIYRTVNEDAGAYNCVAKNEAGVVERKVTLMLQSAPVFTLKPSDTVAEVGDRVQLHCQAGGEPPPVVEWTHNAQPVRENGRLAVLANSTLQILSISVQDAGEYECVARNLLGNAFVRIAVTVQVHGGFSAWVEWGPCSATCGGGVVERIRLCNNPLPAHGGRACHGADVESRHCDSTPCQVDGQWTGWGSWSRCTTSCGGGFHQRSRSCFDPPPQYGGRLCQGSDVDIQSCNLEPCPVDGKWASWSVWTPCSRTCGGGQSKRHRACSNPPPASGGNTCSGAHVQMQRCGTGACPVNGGWSSWQPWSECSASCGEGKRLRERRCDSPAPNGNGKSCPGDDSDTASCGLDPCAGVPGRARGSLIGIINNKEFGVAFLDANVTENSATGITSVQAIVQNLPVTIGPLIRVLASTFTPIYWSVANPAPGTANGFSLTKGVFRQESQVEFATGEVLRMTHVSRGVDAEGVLLFDIVINGNVPRMLASADITVKDFSERYVQTGPGQLYGWSNQMLLQDGSPISFQCNHTIVYESTLGRQTSVLQILKAEYISVYYSEATEELSFHITTSFRKDSKGDRCPEGFVLDSDSYCADLDECQRGTHTCHFGQDCQNEAGSYRCMVHCGIGFRRSAKGPGCEDVDECKESSSPPCHQRCLNAIGTYWCACEAGFQLLAQRCVDINECNMNVCHPDQECRNTEGGYHCLESCPRGTIRLPTGTCGDVDECKVGTHMCRYNQKCENTVGRYRCICPRGYRSQGVGRPCLDVDECQQQPKPCGYRCHNLVGSYKCVCPPGKQLLADAKSCAGLEKLRQNNSAIINFRPQLVSIGQISHIQQNGQNQVNPFYTWLGWQTNREFTVQDNRKPCPTGYRERNGRCMDINECQTWNFCQHDCRNTAGSYKCLCPPGYRLLANGRSCQDIDECREQNIKCGLNQMCFNTRGSHQCIDTPCPTTYRKGASPGTCFRRCLLNCAAGPLALQYKLLTLPNGIPARHDVIRLSAFSERGVLQSGTNFTAVEVEAGSPFSVRSEGGRGIVQTLRPLTNAGVHRLKVRAATYGQPGKLKYQSVFVIYIAISPYPY